MSCKVLQSLPEEDIQALPWLRGNAPGGAQGAWNGQVERRRSPRADETAGLQARIDELTASLEKKTRAASELGFREGEAAARQKLEADFRASAARLAEAIAELSQRRIDALKRAEADAVRLAMEIARRVIYRELSVDPGALEGLFKAALEKLINHEILRVRVHPALEKVLSECIARNVRSRSVEIVADSSQPAGGVIFEISRGALDASVDTQLREIERGLIDELKNRA
ncbi:MAG TPA: FliH/SctL family protein [Bryobacteraceae bacterium]|jgi:flagellar assembly protein FliH|nr:FliH/SctL family protein [Bryobacteraceae bacterium]